jgi:nuclear receptor interaction protein
MLGRDTSAEKGTVNFDDDGMGKATRCVRRFAPGGKRRMRHLDDGHITACKISDANPNEMIVSWSGDHIYSFDLIRSPDASEMKDKQSIKGKSGRVRRSSRSRKRKRQKPASPESQGSDGRHESRRWSGEPDTFRIQYENGEAEDVPFPSFSDGVPETPEDILERARYSVLSDAQRLSMEIAKGLVKLRKTLFSLGAAAREATEPGDDEHEQYKDAFSSASDIATTCLKRMEMVMHEWRYPLNPTSETVAFQQSLRRNRESSWRFVLAAGNLAQELGEIDPCAELNIGMIRPAPGEDTHIDRKAQFCYDFLRAIILWLQGGIPCLLEGFSRHSGSRRGQAHDRYPIPDDAGSSAIDNILIPYLLELASDAPIVNVDASRFEHDSTRFLFQSQRAAVTAFGNAIKLPLENLGGSAARFDRRRVSNVSSEVRSLDRDSARKFWLLRVGRGILMEAGSGVNYTFVNNAFGGLHTTTDDSGSDSEPERDQNDIDPNVEEERIRQIELVKAGSSREADQTANTGSDTSQSDSDDNEEDSSDEDEDGWALDSSDEDEDEGGDEDDDDDEDEEATTRRYAIRKSRQEKVELNTPCSSHMRSYRGHCNIKTVKDVNFFGLNDEYVVSGSDSGHIFIWDRKTSHLVNILEGDSEVVNVVQGM